MPVSNSNPKGNLGTGRQAAAHREGSTTTTPSIALALIKCQLTLGGAQATMHDWVLTLDQTNKHDFIFPISDSNPKGNLGTSRQAAAMDYS